jgi:uncharacterized surface protein with fasciclin (FAS1) repeats
MKYSYSYSLSHRHLACVLVALLAERSHAFSSGAGQCLIGSASPSGLHLTQPSITTGALSDGGYSITVNGQTVGAGDTATASVGVTFDITLAGPDFKGVLILVAGQEDTVIIQPGPDLALALNCAGVAAITHTSTVAKTSVGGAVTMEAAVATTLELNIVVSNSNGVSTYYYSQVMLDVVEPAVAAGPTAAPTVVPTAPVGGISSTGPPDTSNGTTPTLAPTGSGSNTTTTTTTTTTMHNSNSSNIGNNATGGTTPSVYTIIELDDNLSSLRGAIMAADLVSLLQTGVGPYTVFAPNNDAFAAADGLVTKLLLTTDWNVHLQVLLKYHVHAGRLLSSDIMDNTTIATLTSPPEDVVASVGNAVTTISGTSFADSAVVQPNLVSINGVDFSNGVVHIVDKVFIPTALTMNLYVTATSFDGFSQVAGLIATAGLEDVLSNDTVTIFAPSNDAFAALDPALIASLAADTEQVVLLLSNHIVEGIWYTDKLTDGLVLTSLAKLPLVVSVTTGNFPTVMINNATIVTADLVASNGIGHILDSLLLAAAAATGNATTMAPVPPSAPTAPTTAPPPPTPPKASGAVSRMIGTVVAVSLLFVVL